MREQWKPVVGYEGHYEVSDHGNVRSVDRMTSFKRKSELDGLLHTVERFRYGKVLSQRPLTSGYMYVHLCVNNKRNHRRVQRLVMMAFQPREDMDKLEVNHINNVRTDNRLSNLEWVTRSENMTHAHKYGNATSPLADPEIRGRRWK